MKITVFTGNQPRHIALIESLAAIAEHVYAVQECTTLFPGRVADFYQKSPVMQDYFNRVIAAEAEVFGHPRFLPTNSSALVLKSGDLNYLERGSLGKALESDLFIVFGASYIKGWLIDYLVSRKAYNLHMGVSPYYRGSACNFWALYDKRAEYIGATVHLLSKGLDSGSMLLHALPQAQPAEPFVLGMRAVKTAHTALIHYIKTGELIRLEAIPQDKSQQLRYSRISDFNEIVAQDYLTRLPSPENIERELRARHLEKFLRPFID